MARESESAREGSRWINQRPSGDEVASWFVQNAPMHEGLEAERYVTGVTLIPAKDKPKILSQNGQVIDGPEQLVWTPYVKVETRVAYFWDLMAAHPEWVGVIEPEPVKQLETSGYRNTHLPEGFFHMPIQKADGKHVMYLGQSQRVRVYKADTLAWVDAYEGGRKVRKLEGIPVMSAPAGTKVVPTLNKWGEDPNAVMKAQTGALGRALGMAGMLVIPGSGVATAEDIQEAIERPGGVGAELPGDTLEFAQQAAAATMDLKGRAEELIARLSSDHPKALEAVQEWAKQRKLNLAELTPESPALRGVVRQLEKAVTEAEGDDGGTA
jgi:hypothetical protein